MDDRDNPYRLKEAVIDDEVVAFLNEILRLDRQAVSALFNVRVPCGDALGAHPTVQVQAGTSPGESLSVGPLGVLNGIFGADEDGWGPISMEVSDDGTILQFFKTPSPLARKWGPVIEGGE